MLIFSFKSIFVFLVIVLKIQASYIQTSKTLENRNLETAEEQIQISQYHRLILLVILLITILCVILLVIVLFNLKKLYKWWHRKKLLEKKNTIVKN